MTTFVPKRHERGTDLHRYCVRNDDIQSFGEWLVFWGGVLALAAGVSLIVAVAGWGWRKPLELIAEFLS